MSNETTNVNTARMLLDLAELLRQADMVRGHLSRAAAMVDFSADENGAHMANLIKLDEDLNRLSAFLRDHAVSLNLFIIKAQLSHGDEWKGGS